jgi:hypothetical protein
MSISYQNHHNSDHPRSQNRLPKMVSLNTIQPGAKPARTDEFFEHKTAKPLA